MSVRGENVTNSQLTHYNKARQIRERHPGLIAKAKPQFVRPAKTLYRDPFDDYLPELF